MGDAARQYPQSRPDLTLDGMLVEAMAKPGLEMIVGARRDPKWGPIVTVGLGGIWIEALHDVRLLPADLDSDDIIEELLKLKGAALLRGLRGAPPVDLDALADIVARLGALMRADRASPRSRSIRSWSTRRACSRSTCCCTSRHERCVNASTCRRRR